MTTHYSNNTFTSVQDITTDVNSIDLWLLKIDHTIEKIIDTYGQCLSTEEKERAAGFSLKRAEYLLTRIFLRRCLALYAKEAPESLRFVTQPRGKPLLVGTHKPLHFNLSHSGDLVALAISQQTPVGIDIETGQARNIMNIARRYFHPQEVSDLATCSGHIQEQLFFQLWTLKEAFFKATGGGIATGLHNICFRISDDHIAAQLSEDLRLADLTLSPADWQFYYSQPTSHAHMALATCTPIRPSLRWFNADAVF